MEPNNIKITNYLNTQMTYFEITDLDWNLFEEKYNISRTEIVEVNNIYRTVCRLFVHKPDLNLWKEKTKNWEQFKHIEINFYKKTNTNTWVKMTLKD